LEDEVIPLVYSGPPSNRLDLVFMGDGYIESEKDQMIDDMKRLVNDMFTGDTFTPYLPLFNVWVVWRESAESGIGVGGVPKNTAFRLYRDGTQLRGVYCGNPTAARQACALTGPNACDYPTLIGNSPFYGGLGGEFTISTSSESSGTIVLRHELGHNLGQVGEEYDGGTSYFGANYASTLAQVNTKWSSWLSEPPPRAEDSILRLQDYPWYLLENGPRQYTFSSDGQYGRWFLRFTVSGAPEPNSLGVFLDGVALPWQATGNEDRMFYNYITPSGFTAGQHTLRFQQNSEPTGDYKRQLCSLTLHEYKPEPQFHWDNDHVSAYRVWRQGNTLAGYRPTNEGCLMRNMSSPKFCDPCLETMWLQFFAQVSAIDNITVSCNAQSASVTLNVIPLAQFREPAVRAKFEDETYTLTWFRNNVADPSLDDTYTWSRSRAASAGLWEARLVFSTSQVRYDPNNLLSFIYRVTIPASGTC